jgi:tripartite-type tricarboxylate transporter receptor subunit TctC
MITPFKYSLRFSRAAAASAGAALIALCGSCASAAANVSVEDFYKHNSLVLVVASDATGEYDEIGRLLARHLAQHIPGNPTIIVQNRGGASGITAANYLYSVAPRDGSVIGTMNKSIPFYEVTGVANTNYKADQYNWLGTFTRSNNLVTVMARTGVEALDDAKKKSVTMGSIGAGGTMSTYPLLLNKAFGTKFKLVQGYAGAQLVDLAMQRGEVDGRCGLGWDSIASLHPDWLRDKKIKILV